jgi:hypothetical protein
MSRCGGFFFLIYLILPAAQWPFVRLGLLTEMSTRNIPGSKRRPVRRAVNPTAICEPRSLRTLWAFTDCYRDRFTLPYETDMLCEQNADSMCGKCALIGSFFLRSLYPYRNIKDYVLMRRFSNIFRPRLIKVRA